jgi:hypothetical protein
MIIQTDTSLLKLKQRSRLGQHCKKNSNAAQCLPERLHIFAAGAMPSGMTSLGHQTFLRLLRCY